MGKKQFQKQQQQSNFNHLQVREPDLFPFIFEQVIDNDKILLVSRKNSKDRQIFDLGQILPEKGIDSEIYKAFEGLENYSEYLVENVLVNYLLTVFSSGVRDNKTQDYSKLFYQCLVSPKHQSIKLPDP